MQVLKVITSVEWYVVF